MEFQKNECDGERKKVVVISGQCDNPVDLVMVVIISFVGEKITQLSYGALQWIIVSGVRQGKIHLFSHEQTKN